MTVHANPPMTPYEAQMIIDEGLHKMRTYGADRVIVLHKWRAYIVQYAPRQSGRNIEVYNDINQLVAVSSGV